MVLSSVRWWSAIAAVALLTGAAGGADPVPGPQDAETEWKASAQAALRQALDQLGKLSG
jgi:hypothetical protein